MTCHYEYVTPARKMPVQCYPDIVGDCTKVIWTCPLQGKLCVTLYGAMLGKGDAHGAFALANPCPGKNFNVDPGAVENSPISLNP